MDSVFGRSLLIFGPEPVTARRQARQRMDLALAERPTAAAASVLAEELDSGRLAELAGGSLLAESSIVVIQGVENAPASLFPELLRFAAEPYPELCLILVHAGGVKGRGLLDKLKKIVQDRVECPQIKAWELPKFATQEAKQAGGRIEPAAAATLVEAVGADTQAISAAVKQLLADADDGFIRDRQVRRYFAGRADVSSFAVADEILAGNLTGALEKARWLLDTGDSPVALTSATAAAFRQLGRYLEARAVGMSEAQLAKEAGIPPWKIKDFARKSRSWKAEQVAEALAAVALADAEVKGLGVDPGYAIDKMVLAIVRLRR